MNKELKECILEILDKHENLGPLTVNIVNTVIDKREGTTIHDVVKTIEELEVEESIFMSNRRWYSYPKWMRESKF